MIPDSVIEEIRARVDATAVIGRHVSLRKRGASFAGSCPFHAERTPSFRVYAGEKRFRCFGCGAHGDVFEFLQRIEGKEFPLVIRGLAAELGIAVPEETATTDLTCTERAGALAACEAAASHWTSRLWSPAGDEARRYLAGRGVGYAVARKFRLGAAAKEWHDLHRSLPGRNGLRQADLARAGVIADKAKGAYDWFRDRLMLPISAPDSRVIGFGGRALGTGGPKYLNTPETVLYRKSCALFGLAQARKAIGETGMAVVVEGYFDVVLLHQAGVRNAVAVCGTTVTPGQLEALKDCGCRELVVLFDGDAAGTHAVLRLAGAIFGAGLPARVGKLAGDPDEFVRAHGRAGVEGVFAAAPTLTEHLIDQAILGITATTAVSRAPVEQKIAIVRALMPHALAIPEGLPRSAFERRIAQRLALDIGALRSEVSRAAIRCRAAAPRGEAV